MFRVPVARQTRRQRLSSPAKPADGLKRRLGVYARVNAGRDRPFGVLG